MDAPGRFCPHGRTVLAEHQTRGKGRMGRTWFAPSGRNLSLSVALRSKRTLGGWVTLAGACSAVEALRSQSVAVGLKWPNDVVAAPDCGTLADLKVGGVLCETRTEGGDETRYVLGIGLNINVDQAEFPEELNKTATSARMLAGRMLDRNSIAAEILGRLDPYWAEIEEGSTGRLLDNARAACLTLGHLIRVQYGGRSVEGLAEDLDQLGRLVLRLESGVRRMLDVGEIEQTRRID